MSGSELHKTNFWPSERNLWPPSPDMFDKRDEDDAVFEDSMSGSELHETNFWPSEPLWPPPPPLKPNKPVTETGGELRAMLFPNSMLREKRTWGKVDPAMAYNPDFFKKPDRGNMTEAEFVDSLAAVAKEIVESAKRDNADAKKYAERAAAVAKEIVESAKRAAADAKKDAFIKDRAEEAHQKLSELRIADKE